jgi:hypothetical protein
VPVRQALIGVMLLVALAVAPARAARLPAIVDRAVPGYDVTVAVPANWSSEKPPAKYAAVGLVRFFRDPTVISGFRANLNVIVSPLAPAHTLHQWLFSGASASLPSVGKTTPVTVAGVHGLHYVSTKAQRIGDVPLLTDQYAFLHDGRVYLFTYTSLASSQTEYEPLFAASAKTIRFVKPGAPPPA